MKKKLFAILFILLVVHLSSCKKENKDSSDNTSTILTIGQKYQGGIIFYIDTTGQHGLIVTTSDQTISTGIMWYNGSNITTNATIPYIGYGSTNTANIISAQGMLVSYAATLCVNFNGGGYNDWFLPSKDELDLLYKGRLTIGGFVEGEAYWSSTEASSNQAWAETFASLAVKFVSYKDNTFQVRAIRAF